jgi:hypothetical protein
MIIKKTQIMKIYKLFNGLKKIGEFNTILAAKQYADNSGLYGVFNLLGQDYRDSWYAFKNNSDSKNAEL